MSQPEEQARALIVLTPAESKRLIARAVVRLPEVVRARRQGRIVIGNGTTNAFIAEELTGEKIDKISYAAGVVWRGELGITPGDRRLSPVVLVDGERVSRPYPEVAREFGAGDVFIKGANAVDPQGRAGILLASGVGGTIGSVIGIIAARGSRLVVAVGLEKMVPCVLTAARKCGSMVVGQAHGIPCGMMPVVNATVITELEALRSVADVEATHVASGGVDGCEGAVVIAVEGAADAVQEAFSAAQAAKGEPPVRSGAGDAG